MKPYIPIKLGDKCLLRGRIVSKDNPQIKNGGRKRDKIKKKLAKEVELTLGKEATIEDIREARRQKNLLDFPATS